MTRSATALALLLSPCVLAAQASRDLQSQSLVYNASSQVIGCPVWMQAQQRPSDHLLVARDGQRTTTFVQRISLTLTGRQITSATVLAHGLTDKGRIVLSTASREAASGDISRLLTLTFAGTENQRASADLVLPGFTAVTSIELVSLTYSDGTAWRVSMQRPCRIAPDPLMLISNP